MMQILKVNFFFAILRSHKKKNLCAKWKSMYIHCDWHFGIFEIIMEISLLESKTRAQAAIRTIYAKQNVDRTRTDWILYKCIQLIDYNDVNDPFGRVENFGETNVGKVRNKEQCQSTP
jgi:hypothetical protein